MQFTIVRKTLNPWMVSVGHEVATAITTCLLDATEEQWWWHSCFPPRIYHLSQKDSDDGGISKFQAVTH